MHRLRKRENTKTPRVLWCHYFQFISFTFQHTSLQKTYTNTPIRADMHPHKLPTGSSNSLKHWVTRFLNIPRGWRSPRCRRWPSALQRGLLWGTSLPRHEWPPCWGHRTRRGTGRAWGCCTAPPCRLRRTSTSPGSLDTTTFAESSSTPTQRARPRMMRVYVFRVKQSNSCSLHLVHKTKTPHFSLVPSECSIQVRAHTDWSIEQDRQDEVIVGFQLRLRLINRCSHDITPIRCFEYWFSPERRRAKQECGLRCSLRLECLHQS